MRVETLLRYLILQLVALSLLHWIGEILVIGFGAPRDGLIAKFYLDFERNIPTMVSSGLLLGCAFCAYAIGSPLRLKELKIGYAWYAVCGGFAFLAADEMLEIHEILIEPMRRLTGGQGVLFQAWVPVYLGLLGIALAIAWPVIRQLPRVFLWRCGIGAGVFVLGAAGMEIIGGFWMQNDERDTWGYAIVVYLEEILELSGSSLMLLALLRHIATEQGGINLYELGEDHTTAREFRRRITDVNS